MKRLGSDELHSSIQRALAEVDRRLATGELDGSGRFFSDEELANGAALGDLSQKKKSEAAPAT